MTRNTINHGTRASLLTLVVLLLVGCNAPICQECINRAPDAPIFTDFVPLRSSPSTVAPIPEGVFAVIRAIDGDTIVIDDGTGTELRVRLIGVDAPEIRPMQPFGQEAKDFVEQMIEAAGGYVRLQFDGDGTDRSGRIRAHVHLTINGDDVWLNNLLVLEGLAVSMLAFRYSDGAKRIFVQSEIVARREQRGMWALPNPPFP